MELTAPHSPRTQDIITETCRRLMAVLLALVMTAASVTMDFAVAAPAAKKLFGSKSLPAALQPRVHGFYSKGCIAGAVAIPVDGPNWQAMRLSRNRRWGHPTLISIIEKLSYKAKADGWNGLMVGDISQPRGGPMLTGHRSHQLGLDADLWFMPMPDKRLSYQERENTSAVSILKKGSVYIDDSRWTRAHAMLLYHAASFPEVERILVHPGVKKKLCDTIQGSRGWLRKIRPYWGHHYHFHLRIGCPKDSPDCRPQDPTGSGTGCDSSLAWWFDVAFAPKKPAKKPAKPAKPKKRRELVLSDLPQACSNVLQAGDRDLIAATHRIRESSFVAPQINIPRQSVAAVLNSKPIEASKAKQPKNPPPASVPVPTPRPSR